MTKLFNLESYIQCCQYALVFKDSSNQLNYQSGEAYKLLLDKYADNRYLATPLINHHLPSQLTINPTKLDYLSVGTQLTHGEKQRLFIIRDTLDLMTLSTSNILGHKDGYLYSSAYHYWNHYLEIHQHGITKPLVFVDLDNFGISTLIPIRVLPENTRYQIPILDTRTPNQIVIDNYNCVETYTNICHSVACLLLNQFTELSNSSQTVNHLTAYLQKINFLQFIQPYVNQQSLGLIIEIYHNEEIFYKQVNLSMSKLANIVCKQINFSYLNQIANKYPQYKFVLVSQYNIFEEIKTSLVNFICLNPSSQQFQAIWTEKNNLDFPLFAIYLDDIEFAVAIDGKKEWIKLSHQKDAISYEGKPTVLIGSIPSKNQDFVRIPQERSSVNLPIRVNSDDYCINSVPQDYKIEIENYQGTEEVLVQIEFNLQPGSFPQLKVRDLGGRYRINTSLIDREQTYYSHIPPKKITINRQQKSLSQIKRLERGSSDFQSFIADLNLISDELDKIISQGYQRSNYDLLVNHIKNAHQKNRRKADLLEFIDISSNHLVVTELITVLQNTKFYRIVDVLYNLLTSNHRLNPNKKDFLLHTIILNGKLYYFSKYVSSDKLFFQLQFNTISQINNPKISNQYLQCLARIAINEKLQQKYFSLFDSQYSLENSQYLWGYGRILLWHYNFFNTSTKIISYRENFLKIINYLLVKPYRSFQYQYKQNAFLSLIYLLSFRYHYSEFCQPNSEEYLRAKQVIDHFQNDRIILNTVSREKSLNLYFQEMLERRSTEDGIDNLIQV